MRTHLPDPTVLTIVFLGVIGYGAAYWFVPEAAGLPPKWQAAMVIPITVLLVVICGTLCGALLPLLFQRLGFDPALMSSPFVAGIIDIVGIVLYMNVGVLVLGTPAGHLDRLAQNDHGGCAVDVVVAVHENLLLSRDSRPDALDGRAHARQTVGVVELIEAGSEESLGLVGFGHAALRQQNGHEARQLRGGLDALGGVGIEFAVDPALPHSVATMIERSRSRSRAAGVTIDLRLT